MTIYMKIPDMQGNVSSADYKDWIALYSIDFDVKRYIEMATGCSSNRESSSPKFSEVQISKKLDPASNKLWQYACMGKTIPLVDIHLCTTGNNIHPYAKYQLSNVIIAQNTSAAHSGNGPIETLNLNYTKLELTYIERDQTNQQKAPQISSYDLQTAQVG